MHIKNMKDLREYLINIRYCLNGAINALDNAMLTDSKIVKAECLKDVQSHLYTMQTYANVVCDDKDKFFDGVKSLSGNKTSAKKSQIRKTVRKTVRRT